MKCLLDVLRQQPFDLVLLLLHHPAFDVVNHLLLEMLRLCISEIVAFFGWHRLNFIYFDHLHLFRRWLFGDGVWIKWYHMFNQRRELVVWHALLYFFLYLSFINKIVLQLATGRGPVLWRAVWLTRLVSRIDRLNRSVILAGLEPLRLAANNALLIFSRTLFWLFRKNIYFSAQSLVLKLRGIKLTTRIAPLFCIFIVASSVTCCLLLLRLFVFFGEAWGVILFITGSALIILPLSCCCQQFYLFVSYPWFTLSYFWNKILVGRRA